MHPDGKAHGGSAIIIKKHIKHHLANSFQKEYIQATNIVVYERAGPITFSAIYCPPKHNIKSKEFSDFFASLGNRFLAGGDYNAKHTFWGSRISLPKGRELLKTVQMQGLEVISSREPTYWPSDTNKIPDLIDFCITKGIPRNRLRARNSFELSSDHSPVIINMSSHIVRKESKCTLHNRQTNWHSFRNIIDSELPIDISLKTEEEVIQAVEIFTKCVQKAAWESTPTRNQYYRNIKSPQYIVDAIAEKRKLRKIWQRTRCPYDKKRLNHTTRRLKRLLDAKKNEEVQTYLQNLTPTVATDYSLWKATKSLKQPQTQFPPIRRQDGGWARSEKDKAHTFAEHLAQVFTPNPYEGLPEDESAIHDILNGPQANDVHYTILRFTKHEVASAIRQIGDRKAPGYDLITSRVLKELPKKGIMYVTTLFNAVLRLSFFPPQWKVAETVMILKPGKPAHDPKSYRPISLLPITAKVLERLLLTRILHVIAEKKVIPEHQFGFRSKHGTIDQIHRIVEKIHDAFESKEYCSAVFIDISQAFDRVWHEGLLSKIKQNLPDNLFQIIKSYLTNRQFRVRYGESTTGLYAIEAGVPQGSVLGPVLYLLHTADLPYTPNTLLGTFADDTAILASHKDPAIASEILQQSLNNICLWLKKWRIKANEAKSVHVTFTLRRDTCPPVILNGVQVPQEQEVRYLGLHLDRRLTWKKHIFTKRKQLSLLLRRVFWLLNRKSKLSLENKILLYKSIIKPVWTYGVQLWGSAAESNVEIIQRFQSKTLRMIVDAPWFVTNDIIHADLKIPMVRAEATKIASKYKDRLIHHPNQLASGIISKRKPPRRLKRRIPHDLMPS